VNLKVWRISKPGHGKATPNGTGAHRWNSPGAPIIYAAESRALAVLEMLGHLKAEDLLDPYVLIEIGVPGGVVRALDESSLPARWRSGPPPSEAKEFGDGWLRRAECPVLRVPSALLPDEYNFLLNTQHPEFFRLSFGEPLPFRFDSCLIKGGGQ